MLSIQNLGSDIFQEIINGLDYKTIKNVHMCNTYTRDLLSDAKELIEQKRMEYLTNTLVNLVNDLFSHHDFIIEINGEQYEFDRYADTGEFMVIKDEFVCHDIDINSPEEMLIFVSNNVHKIDLIYLWVDDSYKTYFAENYKEFRYMDIDNDDDGDVRRTNKLGKPIYLISFYWDLVLRGYR